MTYEPAPVALSSEPIAIVGMACRFPGARGPEAYWSLLREGADAITGAPSERFDVDAGWGGFVEGAGEFDAAFFGLSAHEACRMDPQQRLLLEVAWEALEDGGQPLGPLAGDTGVFVGVAAGDYRDLVLADPAGADVTGCAPGVVAGRISWALGLRGPSLEVDTAGSSSLVAVHLACQSLRSGECAIALAAGVNLVLSPAGALAYSRARLLAPDGRSKFGDARADGFARSDGAGVVVLKPLSAALAAGDPIRAVIRGSAVNHDGGPSAEPMTPNGAAREAVVRAACAAASVRPGQLRYVEADGTGTAAGDAVEITALGRVLSEGREAGRPCPIGSVKTNIGHAEAAAGVAGLIKVVLCLERGMLPPSLHLQEPSPAVPWAELPVTVPAELGPLPDGLGPVVVGVSSSGISGTNAHVVLEQAPPPAPVDARPPAGKHLLALSARSPASLADLARAHRDLLAGPAAPPLSDVCWTAGTRRSHHEHRLALIAASRDQMVAEIDAYLAGWPSAGVVAGGPGGHDVRPLVFVYSGDGSHWPGMGRDLLHEPAARAVLEACDRQTRAYAGWSLLDEVTAGAGRLVAGDVEVAQPATVAVQMALTALWRSWGVEPDAVVGHGTGEVAAAWASGALRLEDALQVACQRARLLAGLRGWGAMAVVELSAEDAARALAGFDGQLAVAAVNGRTETVIAGRRDALAQLLDELHRREVFARPLAVDVAPHTADVDGLLPDLLRDLDGLRPARALLPWYSSVTGAVVDGRDCAAGYWARNLREPVRFAAAMCRLNGDGHGVFLELGPHPLLQAAIGEAVGSAGLVLPSLRRDEEARAVLLPSLASLYAAGRDLRWAGALPAGGQFVRLPAYPWRRERLWAGPRPQPEGGAGLPALAGPIHPVLGGRVALARPEGSYVWEVDLGPSLTYLRDHRVGGVPTLPGAAYADLALAAGAEILGGRALLEEVEHREPLRLGDGEAPSLQILVTPAAEGGHVFSIFSRAERLAEAEPAWTLHAAGRLHAAGDESEAGWGSEVAAAAARCTQELSGSAFYRLHDEAGDRWGPAFRGVERVWRRPGEALALILTPTSLDAGTDAGGCHPAVLDACGQVLAAAGTAVRGAGPFVLQGVDRVWAGVRPGPRLWSHAVLRSEDDGGAMGDVTVVDDRGDLVVRLEGLRFQRLDHVAAGAAGDGVESWLYRSRWLPGLRDPAPVNGRRPAPGVWLLLADRRRIGEAVAMQLAARGEECVVATPGVGFWELGPGRFEVRPDEPDHLTRLVAAADERARPLRGVVHLWSLDAVSPEEGGAAALEAAHDLGCVSALHLVQALADRGRPGAPRLWLVTGGVNVSGQDRMVSVAQSALWGLGRVAAQEHPELRTTLVDLPADPAGEDVDELCRELLADGGEDQVVLSGGVRLVARLARHAAGPPEEAPVPAPCRLEIREPGILDDLELRPAARRQPGPGEVEIEVQAAGLSFRDVLLAMGAYPGQPAGGAALGWECAGRVLAVGPNVDDLEPGDEVLAIAHPALATHVVTLASLVVRRPAGLGPQAAAGLPIAFTAAHHALHGLARVRPGERVLVHCASGGLGHAAVLLAREAGADVLATAGSPEKRAHLAALGIRHVFDSRSLDFVDGVLRATDGEGVDVVLNSLQGDAIQASLSLLRPYGRFVELGKRDIRAGARLGLRAFDRNLSFFALDVVRMAEERPVETGAVLREVVERIAAGALQPPDPASAPLTAAPEVFRRMSQAGHIGKQVLTPDAGAATSGMRSRMRPDRTYLLTGGLGGLGLAVASWLVDRGARRLVLVGRTGLPGMAAGEPSADRRAAAVQRMEERGAMVRAAAVDAADEEQMRALLASLDADGWPPVGGAIHAAGVLGHRPLAELTAAELRAVLRPKVAGAWLLHSLLRDAPLDFFVLFASASSLLGSPQLGASAAADAFLDALANCRRSLGLPGLSIDWGFWAEVGMVADHRRAEGRDLAPFGVGSFTVAQGLAALDVLLAGAPAQVAVVAVDWPLWRHAHPRAAAAPFLAGLADAETAPPEPVEAADEGWVAPEMPALVTR